MNPEQIKSQMMKAIEQVIDEGLKAIAGGEGNKSEQPKELSPDEIESMAAAGPKGGPAGFPGGRGPRG